MINAATAWRIIEKRKQYAWLLSNQHLPRSSKIASNQRTKINATCHRLTECIFAIPITPHGFCFDIHLPIDVLTIKYESSVHLLCG